MKISVIVPNYNHERFLERRLESILAQSWQDFELIILDDASTDGSRSIIKRYEDNEKVSGVFYNEQNSGSAFKQWQKGIAQASGEWIWIAESDDYCKSNFLETLMRGIDQQDDVVLAFAQSFCVKDDGSVSWQSNYEGPSYVTGTDLFRQRLVYGCTIFNASMAIFKRSAALAIADDYGSFRQCGDWYFWIQLVQKGRVFISPALLNYYRKEDSSLTSLSYASGLQYVEELDMFKRLLTEMPAEQVYIERSVYNRYNSFKRNGRKYNKSNLARVTEAFYAFFGGRYSLHLFVLKMDVRRWVRKLRKRTGLIDSPYPNGSGKQA